MTSSAPKDAKFLDVEPVEATQVLYLSNLSMRVRTSVELFEKLSEPKEFIDGLISEIDELSGYADDQVDAMRVLRDAIVQSLHHIPEPEKDAKGLDLKNSTDAP